MKHVPCPLMWITSVLLIVGVIPSPLVLAADKQHVVLAPHVEPLPNFPQGPFVRLGDGGILSVDGSDAIISHDDGKTWKRRPIFKPGQHFSIRPERPLLRTRRGVIILIFSNNAVLKYSWDRKKNLPKPDMHLPSYAIRSLDDGRTWTDLTLLDNGWCGGTLDAIETTSGNIVVPVERLDYDKGRHVTIPYLSTDAGKTWKKTARTLDIGGRGDHAGALEGTLEQLRDGRLWLLLRSYHGFFYESFSSDQGLTWSQQKPSKIKSTGSPGKLKRLASGRLVLLWNALPNRGFRHREELSMSFSEDDGVTWTPPQVIARNKGGRVSYPHIFEYSPGLLWITTMQGDLRVKLREKDFLKHWTRMVAFGDSTTAPRGKLLVYADLLQRELPRKGVYASVINAGVGSSTTEGARKRFQHDVLAQKPKLVIIQFGINDAAVDVWKTPPAQKPRVTLARYRKNLIDFIDSLRRQKVKVVLMTPNPMRWTPKLRRLYGKTPYDPAKPDGFNIILNQYAETVRRVAKEKQVDLVDVYSLYEAYDRQPHHAMDELLLDGMHPNQKGQRLTADRLTKTIAGRLKP